MADNLTIIIGEKKFPQTHYWTDFLPLVDNSIYKVVIPASLLEKVLISKLKTGDSSAFSDIFTAYYKDLVMFGARFTKDLNSAEEIVQDTFVKIWEEHESINVSVSLKSYLLKIVQNKCINWCRHKKIMQAHSSFVKESPPQFDYDTDSYILYSELQEKIDAALDKLPKEISDAFRMNRYKGLKYHEISEIQHTSVRTIEVRIGKALNMLRNHLKEYFIILTGIFSLLNSIIN